MRIKFNLKNECIFGCGKNGFQIIKTTAIGFFKQTNKPLITKNKVEGKVFID